jgi:hypothetical protein
VLAWAADQRQPGRVSRRIQPALAEEHFGRIVLGGIGHADLAIGLAVHHLHPLFPGDRGASVAGRPAWIAHRLVRIELALARCDPDHRLGDRFRHRPGDEPRPRPESVAVPFGDEATALHEHHRTCLAQKVVDAIDDVEQLRQRVGVHARGEQTGRPLLRRPGHALGLRRQRHQRRREEQERSGEKHGTIQ